MIKQPLVSVIIPCYNGAAYVGQALESILAQTYPNLEIIVIDDGSTDGSQHIIAAFAQMDKRIKAVRYEQNRKLVDVLNSGIELARGKYIARMDADDIALPTRIERQVRFMEANPDIGLSGTFIAAFDGQGRKRNRGLPVTHERIKAYLFTASAFFHPTVIMRRQVLGKWNLRYESRYYRAEDHALWLNMAEHTRCANLPVVLLKYRLLADSETRLADGNREERRAVLAAIHRLALSKIGVTLSPEEQQLYSCSMVRADMRLVKHRPVGELIRLFGKILQANSASGFADGDYLARCFALRIILFLCCSGQFLRVGQLLHAGLSLLSMPAAVYLSERK
ncbi:glycosyltransferase family 2 protein [Parapedobacter sp. DT-150]|uniref:glycosyltransferase family 2 protein n=1 Tax=Parapedobacter sp. DT-150 TaxID=3396162 RepID=UPI003F1AE04C